MKKYKLTFWIVTALIVAFDSLIPALTFNTPMAIEGIRHLGFPDYFRYELTFFKVAGGIALIFPVKPRIKEWAYAGFTLNFVSAFVANVAVDGFTAMAILPLFMLALLIVSYLCYHKMTADASSSEMIGSRYTVGSAV